MRVKLLEAAAPTPSSGRGMLRRLLLSRPVTPGGTRTEQEKKT